jgi:hypothetical protein
MVATPDENASRNFLLLKMTFQAECRVALNQHFLIHGAVDGVTRCASFTHRFVLKDERSVLRRMALPACVALGSQGKGAAV